MLDFWYGKMKPNVGIIDYGVGNLMSVRSASIKCGADVFCSSDPDRISKADAIILPGVGAFPAGSNALKKIDMFDALKSVSKKGTPILGICLGMQLLFDYGEEFGISEGLGLIKGSVVPLPHQTSTGVHLKIPHIGWTRLVKVNETKWVKSPLVSLNHSDSVYFVHSFVAKPNDPSLTVAGFSFGGSIFPAFVQQNNIIGCQFHPEKSGEAGIRIIKNFVALA